MWWVRRRIHVSWLIALAAGALVVGVIGARSVPQGLFAPYTWLFAGVLLALWGFWRQKVYAVILVVIGGAIIGLWRGSVEQHSLQAYKNLYSHTVTLTGVVADDVDIGRHGDMRLRITSLQSEDHALGGTVWIATGADGSVQRGDVVTFRGIVEPGFGSFSAVMYRAQLIRVQRPNPGDVGVKVRDWFVAGIRTAIPDPQAALGIGYLVGQRRALPLELDEALQIVGLTHIVVASGYNLTILVRAARRLCMRVSKYAATLAAGGMIVSFVAMTGASPSMSRAGLVAGLSLLAWYYGRKFHPLVLLPFAAALTVLANPSYVWGDLGWQLSFAAFAGVMLLAPLGQAYFFGDTSPGMMRQIAGETIAAQMMTLPILVLAFGQYSNVALIANMLVLPLVPLAMLLTFLAGAGALVAPFAVDIIGVPATWLLQYMIWVSERLAELEWATSALEIQWWHAALAYVAIVTTMIYMQRVTRYDLHESSIIE